MAGQLPCCFHLGVRVVSLLAKHTLRAEAQSGTLARLQPSFSRIESLPPSSYWDVDAGSRLGTWMWMSCPAGSMR